MDAVRVALLREALAGSDWLRATRRFAGALRGSVLPHGGGLLLVGTAAYEPWHLAAHLVDEAAWSCTPELAPTLVRHRVPPGAPPHLSVGLGRLASARRGETLLVVAPEQPAAALLERVHDARRAGATILTLSGPPGRHPRPGSCAADETAAPPRRRASPPSASASGDPVVALPGGAPGAPCTCGGAGSCAAPGTEASGAAPGVGVGGGSEGGGGGELGVLAHEALAVPSDSGLDLEIVQHLVSAAAGENALPTPRGLRRLRSRLSQLADHLTAPPPDTW